MTGKRISINGFLMAAAAGMALIACSLFSPGGGPTSIPTQPLPVNTPLPVSSAEAGDPQGQPRSSTEQIPAAVPSAAIPDPGGFTWKLVADGLDKPVGLVNAGDGSGRLFVLEKPGRIVILLNGERLSEPFLDIGGRVNTRSNERGLLGLAFHPQFAANGYFFVHYSDNKGDTAIARFQVSTDPNRADAGSEKIILTQSQPYGNHNGGMIAFGPDGYLYIGLGDGGSAGDPEQNAQNPNTLLGKMLRIDVDGGDPYSIPADNPYAVGGGRPQIWASGLRNPWRFSFDRQTGDLYIADVGQNTWEEIDFLPAGSPGGTNFGWDYYEGFHYFEGTPPGGFAHAEPVAEYRHEAGSCSVTGGYVYRGAALPEWSGVYLYGDYCSGVVWALVRQADGTWQSEAVFSTGAQISSFGEGEDGELYLVDISGKIFRLERQ